MSQTRGVIPRSELTDDLPRADSFEKYKRCVSGDLVLNRFNAYRGSLGVAPDTGMVSPDYLVLRPRHPGVSRFLDYWLRSSRVSNEMLRAMGGLGAANPDESGFSRIDVAALMRLEVEVNSVEEQRRIAEFLDRETAQIDELIAKQEQLISTLAKRRDALIDELALGRGLDSRACRGPAERWMARVPSGWTVVPSHRLFQQRMGRSLPGDEQLTASQRHGIVRQKDFAEREYSVMQVIKDPTILKHVEPGDFVISMRSFQGGLEYSGLRGCISSAYVMLIPGPRVESSYFRHLFKSTSYIQGLQSTSNLVRDGQALRFENFKKLALPVPPRAIQQSIAREIGDAHGRIDELAGRAKSAVALLRERRQALISAAVAGQIEVGGAS